MIYCKLVAGVVVDRAVFDQPMPSDWPDFDLWRQDDEAQIGWTLEGGELVEPQAPPPEPLDPLSVRLTKRQIERALILSGTTLDPTTFMDTIIGAIPDETDRALALTDWRTAPYYVRYHPLFADSDVLTAAGMTPAAIDGLWLLAKDQPE